MRLAAGAILALTALGLAALSVPVAAGAGWSAPIKVRPLEELSGVGSDDAGRTTVLGTFRDSGKDVLEARRIALDGALGPGVKLTRAEGFERPPNLALAPDGHGAVLWQTSFGEPIMARPIHLDGTPGNKVALSSDEGDGGNLDIGSQGRATATWTKISSSGAISIEARRLDPSGALDTTKTLDSDTFGSDAGDVSEAVADTSVVVGSGDVATVAWNWARQVDPTHANDEIWARQIDAAGTLGPLLAVKTSQYLGPLSGDFRLGTGADDGSVVVVWVQRVGANVAVKARRIDGTGALGATSEIASVPEGTDSRVASPEVGLAPDGTATIVWNEFDDSIFDPPTWAIKARTLSAGGALGTTHTVLGAGTFGGGLQPEPREALFHRSLVVDQDGITTVSWELFTVNDSVSRRPQARRIDVDGSLGTTNTLGADARNGRAIPDVDAQGRVTAAWTGRRRPNERTGLVRASRYGLYPPHTVITKGPSGRTFDRTPTFKFKMRPKAPGATFKCSLDGRKFAHCTSPRTIRPSLNFGRHTLAVAATAHGLTDPTPAHRSFKVKRRRH
jgi:hypothetical protein